MHDNHENIRTFPRLIFVFDHGRKSQLNFRPISVRDGRNFFRGNVELHLRFSTLNFEFSMRISHATPFPSFAGITFPRRGKNAKNKNSSTNSFQGIDRIHFDFICSRKPQLLKLLKLERGLLFQFGGHENVFGSHFGKN